MKIMSWNSRGSAWDGFEAQTLFYVTCFNVDVLCILDTRSSATMLNKTRKLPFDESFVVPSIGQSGGLNLLWKSKSVSINIIAPHDRFIHCHITDVVSNENCSVTFLYAYPKKEKQLALWNDITKLCLTDNSSWVIMGDFNITMSPEEKLGDIGGVTRPMLNFCEFLNNSGHVSLKASGLPFTWTNKHVDDSIIFERLDRALVEYNEKKIFEVKLQDMKSALTTQITEETDISEVMETVKQRTKDAKLPDIEVVRILCHVIMDVVQWSGKNQQQNANAALRQVKTWA